MDKSENHDYGGYDDLLLLSGSLAKLGGLLSCIIKSHTVRFVRVAYLGLITISCSLTELTVFVFTRF